jgi:hypothetical protein
MKLLTYDEAYRNTLAFALETFQGTDFWNALTHDATIPQKKKYDRAIKKLEVNFQKRLDWAVRRCARHRGEPVAD